MYNPLLVLFAGEEIKLGLNDPNDPHVPLYMHRAAMVARDPVACSRFFHCVVTAFLDYIVGTDGQIFSTKTMDERFGVLGDIVAHYAVVESQNRGGLHAHGLYWMHGALRPNEFMEKLKAATAEGSAFRKSQQGKSLTCNTRVRSVVGCRATQSLRTTLSCQWTPICLRFDLYC